MNGQLDDLITFHARGRERVKDAANPWIIWLREIWTREMAILLPESAPKLNAFATCKFKIKDDF